MSNSTKIDQYVKAATRDNTRRSYRSAVEHYEVTWGGFLPATANNIADYLANYAKSQTFNTLKQRTAALAQWHIEQGFPDPTKSSLVKKVLKGIRELHPSPPKQAKPLQLEILSQVVDYLERAVVQSSPNALRHSRDKALILMGFWRGFRSEELCRLSVEYIDITANEGLTLYLPRSKGDRQSVGKTYHVPELAQLCPVKAYHDWISRSQLKSGPVFRGINRWNQIGVNPLHKNSIIPLLRSLLRKAGIETPSQYSSHSLRRGFATWASVNNWDLKTLMEYVGWHDLKSATAYIEANQHRKLFKMIKTT